MMRWKKELVTVRHSDGSDPHHEEGLKSGPFTIHSEAILSVDGIRLLNGRHQKNAKLAAEAFKALPIDWKQPYSELMKQLGEQGDQTLRLECAKIVRKYSSVFLQYN